MQYLVLTLCACLAFLAYDPATVMAAPGHVEVRLPDTWNVQLAESPDRLPAEGQWASMAAIDWRWTQPRGEGLAWLAGLDRTKVHRLWYGQALDIPGNWAGRRVLLDFRRIEGDAIVFLTGARVAEVLRPGGELELTRAVKFGQRNQLLVYVTRDYQGISRGYEADLLRYITRRQGGVQQPLETVGFGITAEVVLRTRPAEVAISDILVLPNWREKRLDLRLELEAAQAQSGLALAASIRDADGRSVRAFNVTLGKLDAGRSAREVGTAWADAIPWELQRPHLYQLECRLMKSGRIVDQPPAIAFGFREIWSEGRQLMLNGHPMRWRPAVASPSVPRFASLAFYRLMGFNVVELQPNPTAWWSQWSETPLMSQEVLDQADATGMGIIAPAPGISAIWSSLAQSQPLQEAYAREMRLWLRRYQNHPSILMWGIGMNYYNPQESISMAGLGRRVADSQHPAVAATSLARQILRQQDPSRLVFGHAAAGTGDLASANVYLNFIPLQEREDWPSLWAHSGDMPFMAAEMGEPFPGNFWKGKRFLMSEYLAMYFGDEAYRTEGAAGLAGAVEASLANTGGFGAMEKVDLSQFPLYWEFQRLFTLNTNRAWRTWGLSGGWVYWTFAGLGFGTPPGPDVARSPFPMEMYGQVLAEPPATRPAWANPNFDIHCQANGPFVAYIAGDPVHTDKTHSYFPGEQIQKNVALVWDGLETRRVTGRWTATDIAGGPVVAEGQVEAELHPGDIKLVPFEFSAGAATARRDLRISLSVQDGQTAVATDSFDVQVIPAPAVAASPRKVYVLDPAGGSASWIGKLAVQATPMTEAAKPEPGDVLVIGREALRQGQGVPFSPDAVAKGLRVLILEQQPEVWEGLGFRVTDTMPRQVFPRDPASPILAGLRQADLQYWRGSPDLLAEGQRRSSDVQHAPKGTNRHAVASVALQIPQAVGFTPILCTEFDLAYSPLLQWRYGKGAIYFSTLDFTARVGSDPAAMLLAAQLVGALTAQDAPPTRAVTYVGADHGSSLLARLGVDSRSGADLSKPGTTLLVIGAGGSVPASVLDTFLEHGGRVLWLNADNAAVASRGITAETRPLRRVACTNDPLTRAVGPNLLRWRDAIAAQTYRAGAGTPGSAALLDGLLYVRRHAGAGEEVFLGIDPDSLLPAKADAAWQDAVQTSQANAYVLLAQILTNLGAQPSQAMAQRLTRVEVAPGDEVLGSWHVLGPFTAEREDGELMLNTKFPGEQTAIAGDTNPNLTFTGSDGRKLDWRRTVKSRDDGFVDLHKDLAVLDRGVAYVARELLSPTETTATLRLSLDWRVIVWVNGQQVFRTTDGRLPPNAFDIPLHLRKGTNSISMKIGAGSRGFGFTATLRHGTSNNAAAGPAGPFYVTQPRFDPYLFTYW